MPLCGTERNSVSPARPCPIMIPFRSKLAMEKYLLLISLLLLYDAQTSAAEDRWWLEFLTPGASTCDSVVRRHLSILLATGFWPGHLYPITALGEELVKRGHNVTLCATVMEGSDLLPHLPHSYGINFVSAGSDNLTQKSYDEAIKGLHNLSRNYLDIFLTAPSWTAGLDNLTHNETIQRLWRNVSQNYLDVFITAPSWTASKVRAKVNEIISNYDILISDLSVLPVGVYHAKLGIKSMIFAPVIPYVHATLSKWPSLLGGTAQTENVSFLERLINVFIFHALMIETAFINTTTIDEEFHRVTSIHDYYNYPGTHIPLICNTVLGFDFPKRTYPLTHYVGPLLMQTTPPLDKSLEDWLSTKQDKTIIYIGMGSTGFMSKDYVQAFVDGVLATIFDVVWTMSTEEQTFLENIDQNRFYVSTWIPRQTLFRHSAIALTLMHCGLNGVQESLSNGLPVICAPHFLDHFEVGTRINAANVGIPLYGVMDLLWGRINITAEIITNTIKIISENGTYHEQAKRMQNIFRFAGGARRASDLVEFYAEVGYDHLIPAYAKYEWSWVHYYMCYLGVFSLLFLLIMALLICCVITCFA